MATHTIEIKFNFSGETKDEDRENYDKLYITIRKLLVNKLKFAKHIVTSDYFIHTSKFTEKHVREQIDIATKDCIWTNKTHLVISTYTLWRENKTLKSLHSTYYRNKYRRWVKISPSNLYLELRKSTKKYHS